MLQFLEFFLFLKFEFVWSTHSMSSSTLNIFVEFYFHQSLSNVAALFFFFSFLCIYRSPSVARVQSNWLINLAKSIFLTLHSIVSFLFLNFLLFLCFRFLLFSFSSIQFALSGWFSIEQSVGVGYRLFCIKLFQLFRKIHLNKNTHSFTWNGQYDTH